MRGEACPPISKHSQLDLQSRYKPFIMAAIIMMTTAGCSSSLFSPKATYTPQSTGTKVVLPPTWTEIPPSETSTPTFTPSPTTSPTITPTHTKTSVTTPTLDQTGETQGQTTATLDWTDPQNVDCTFTATSSGVRILSAPFIDPYRILPTMEPGKPYPAVLTKPTYTLLLDNGQPLGWIDYRLIAVTHEGNDCLSQQDERAITDFSNLCFFTPNEEIFGYNDAEFTETMNTLKPPASFVVLRQSENAYFTAYGSSGPSFLVKKDEVYLHGNCQSIPTLAEVTEDTSIYSNLPDQGGSIVYHLVAGEFIFTQSQTKQGPPPPGVEGTGSWILSRRHSWSEDINGWVWLDHIKYK